MAESANSVATSDAEAEPKSASAGERLLGAVRRLGPQRLAVLAFAALALCAAFGWLLMRVVEPEPALLYAGLEVEDSAQIIRRLESMGVPHQLRNDGTTILVPAERALRLRLTLAEEGLPQGGNVGYEIFDRESVFGTSSAVADVNMKRALEGELARTIGEIDGVRGARVHLVLPKRELFRRERIQPSASITLHMASRTLGARQVEGIRHLVAAAVPDLEPERVTVVDQRGDLLARAGDREAAGLLPGQADEYRNAFETRLESRIEELLERSLGRGRVRTEVTADLDFDQITITEESYDPEGQVVRSTQTIEEETDLNEQDRNEAVGVAGNLPTEDAGGGAASTTNENSTRAEETVNYEISRTVRNHVRAGGQVERLSVAVLVDGKTSLNDAGETVYTALPEEQLVQIETLVRSAIGFDAARGDVVEVINMPFTDPVPVEEASGWLDVSRSDVFRLGELLTLALVAILLVTMVFRPAIKQLAAPAEPELASLGDLRGSQGAVPELEGPETGPAHEPARVDVHQVDGLVRADLVEQVADAIRSKPDEVVGILRTWLQEG